MKTVRLLLAALTIVVISASCATTYERDDGYQRTYYRRSYPAYYGHGHQCRY